MGEPTNLQMQRQSNGHYTTSSSDLDIEGVYTLTLGSAQVATRTVSAHTSPITLSLHPVPMVMTTAIQSKPYYPSQTVTVMATISNADRLDRETTAVLVEIKNAAGHIERSIEPQAIEKGQFVGIATLPSEPGKYQFEWVLKGRTVDGVKFEAQSAVREITVLAIPSTSEVTPALSPTPAPTPSPPDQDSLIERYPWLSLIVTGIVTTIAVGAIVGFVVYQRERYKPQEFSEQTGNIEGHHTESQDRLLELQKFQDDTLNALDINDPAQTISEIESLKIQQQEVHSLAKQLSNTEERQSKVLEYK
jgi:hypothetical protein